MILKDKIAAQLPAWQERVKKLVKEKGTVKADEVDIGQIYGGMRDIKSLVTDISYVDPNEGIRFRQFTIPEIMEKLPKAKGDNIPLAGGLYYLLLVGEIPTLEQAVAVENEWKSRWDIPEYVFNVLKAMPADTHPMTLFSQGILALQRDSVFAKRYAEGMPKVQYWEPTLEDSLNLTAKMPNLAAFIYNLKYRGGKFVKPDPNLDWSANFAYMIGKGDVKDYKELCRLYFILHSDHESGNVSAHATHLVASALSDIYYACSAGMNGLAGPLHGLANQECLGWLLEVLKQFKKFPTKEELEKFAWDTLNSGKVIPGYGHAVLRKPDPRYIAQMEFGKKHMPDDEVFKLVVLVYEVIPGVLTQLGKVKNPWPNVDAISGSLQYHYGVREFDFYTVMFGVSRILGVTANAVWARALGQPIERPKSVTTAMLEETAAKAG
ncbi:MAG: citrate (Si)-synthase [Anaerolineales bacterium]|nr:citrate (Si)-synthase [Anaerolineales bacterium]